MAWREEGKSKRTLEPRASTDSDERRTQLSAHASANYRTFDPHCPLTRRPLRGDTSSVTVIAH